jgi:alkaline phosphatase D
MRTMGGTHPDRLLTELVRAGRRLVVLALGLVSFCLNQPSVTAAPPLAFTHGVASGEVTPFSAVLWTRLDQSAYLRVEVATDPAFQHIALTRTVLASADHDFTAKVLAAPLWPNQQYFYRWRHDPLLSEVGTFTTAPLPWGSANVRFAYSGDSDGTKVDGVPFLNHFEALDAARREALDFFVYLGDTVYPDSPVRDLVGLGPAVTLDEYRDTYKVNREIAALRQLMQATAVYAVWDDHEVRNDYAGQTVAPTLYANGREAFLEYMPILAPQRFQDPACAGTPLFRVFRWGNAVDLIILDERSCRSADVAVLCVDDPAPTLPASLRTLFGLPASPPPGCLDALFDPSRTLLGPWQKAALKAVLRHSKATFKFIINEVPIQQFYTLPYDRWEGYGAERHELLTFIREHHIEHVIFLTTDAHANLINQVFIDRFADPAPVAEEFVTGPIAHTTLQDDILAASGPSGLAAFHALLSLVGVNCRHLDAFSYGLVEVDASAETATITLKDDMGAVLADQQNPSIPCTKTIGGVGRIVQQSSTP